ncbi:MAG: hypothetical protein R3Y24_15595 [Eubacteriales bacterium]
MKEIFEQYGSVIIAVVAISALVAIIMMLLGTDGVVAEAFTNLINNFFNQANGTITASNVLAFPGGATEAMALAA